MLTRSGILEKDVMIAQATRSRNKPYNQKGTTKSSRTIIARPCGRGAAPTPRSGPAPTATRLWTGCAKSSPLDAALRRIL